LHMYAQTSMYVEIFRIVKLMDYERAIGKLFDTYVMALNVN